MSEDRALRTGTAKWRWDPLKTLTETQLEQLDAYAGMLEEFNRHLNLISRASAEEIWSRHVLHSLCIAWKGFPAGARVVDWGTGGGLPTIPLAIVFPDIDFHAVDSVGKKVMAVRTMARRLSLKNVTVWHGRAEDWEGRAHYSVSRATAPLVDLWSWHGRAADAVGERGEGQWRPGLICLKGGELEAEVDLLLDKYIGVHVEQYALAELVSDFFADKYIVAVYEADADANQPVT